MFLLLYGRHGRGDLVPRVSHLTARWGGKMRDPRNEVVRGHNMVSPYKAL